MMDRTEVMREIPLGMSNLGGRIDHGCADALKAESGMVFGRHAGWNFNGLVFFADGKFHEEVWVYRELQETITMDSLEELMTAVNDKYGYD